MHKTIKEDKRFDNVEDAGEDIMTSLPDRIEKGGFSRKI